MNETMLGNFIRRWKIKCFKLSSYVFHEHTLSENCFPPHFIDFHPLNFSVTWKLFLTHHRIWVGFTTLPQSWWHVKLSTEVLSIFHFKEKASIIGALLLPIPVLPHLSPVSMTRRLRKDNENRNCQHCCRPEYSTFSMGSREAGFLLPKPVEV